MMKIFCFFLAFSFIGILQAQVGIGIAVPNPAAQLDVSSVNKGFLPPRLTIVQRNGITNPVAGLQIWCIDCSEMQVYNGSDWTNMIGGISCFAYLPTVITASSSAITTTSIVSGGTVTNTGSATVTSRGVCWGTTINPTIALATKTINGSGTGTFVSNVSGLTPGTMYHVRAYATNDGGTAYGGDSIVNTVQGAANLPNVMICSQAWTSSNLAVTTYRNGDPIPQVTDSALWGTLTTGAWCYLNNNAANGAVYGKLYNWYALTDSRGLAPNGWHIPSDAEWTTLSTCLGGDNVSSGPLKETGTVHWPSPNNGATNSTGFTALPGGYRTYLGGFVVSGFGYWWSSTESAPTLAWSRTIHYYDPILARLNNYKMNGFSVRCVKD